MACSKIFSGELPELLSEIIQYFRNDFSTLHSCILVNRLWCRLAIPLLWENPFSFTIPNQNSYSIEYHKIRFIETYLVKLNDNDKIKLYEFGINNLSHSNILFNYSSFIQYFDAHLIGDCIENWVAVKKNEKLSYSFLENTQNSDFIKFIYKSLIKMFIENEAVLHTFDSTINRHEYFDIISELILQSSNFVCNIKNLYLGPGPFNLSSNCNSISSPYIPRGRNSKVIEYLSHSSQLIKSQKNLKRILFFNVFPHSTSTFSNCLNTLNTIIFCRINFEYINILNEVFEQLNVIESIHIIKCYSLDSNFTQQIINLTKPFKLKSLISNEILYSMELILQKSGDYLEHLDLLFERTRDESLLTLNSQLLELITRYCPKIKFFELYGFDGQNIINLSLNLIKNIEQNLNYLTIDLNYHNHFSYINSDGKLGSFCSIVLQNLGQILPSKLEYLNLSLIMNTNDFVIFLKNSQNIFIKKLLFSNCGIQEKIEKDDMLYYTKEYIMRKEKVNYFAFRNLYTDDFYKWEELYDLKDEVKEFRLHNIKVQNYNNLKIRFEIDKY